MSRFSRNYKHTFCTDLHFEENDHSYCLPENEFDSQKFEKIAGEKENFVWLIMNNKYILHKLREFQNGNIVWECKHRRALACPFKFETSENEELL